MNPTTRKAVSNPESWKKGAVMLLFFLLLAVITPLLMLVSLVGWVFLLVQGQVPESIRSFGRSLAAWYAQTARYLTGDAHRRPFPFEDLDCVTDEPPPAHQAAGQPSRRPGKASAADVKAETAVPDRGAEDPGQVPLAEGETEAKEPATESTVKEKISKKKAAKKKAGRKKTTSKKVGKKKAGSQTAADPTAPAGEQEP
jgi:hypothetical protein